MVKLRFYEYFTSTSFTDNYIWLIEENGKATVVDQEMQKSLIIV